VLVHGVALSLVDVRRVDDREPPVESLLDRDLHLGATLLALPPVEDELLALEGL